MVTNEGSISTNHVAACIYYEHVLFQSSGSVTDDLTDLSKAKTKKSSGKSTAEESTPAPGRPTV